MTRWDYFKYLNPFEAWGDFTKVDSRTLLVIDMLRFGMNAQFIVHNAFSIVGHAENSFHHSGEAVDGHYVLSTPFYNVINRFEDVLDTMMLSDVLGIGIYPTWNNPGFHIDTRGKRARWGRIFDEYVSYEEAKLYAMKELEYGKD